MAHQSPEAVQLSYNVLTGDFRPAACRVLHGAADTVSREQAKVDLAYLGEYERPDGTLNIPRVRGTVSPYRGIVGQRGRIRGLWKVDGSHRWTKHG